MMETNCPFCGSDETRWVDSLGELTHAQCRHCGCVFALEDVMPLVKKMEDFVTYDE